MVPKEKDIRKVILQKTTKRLPFLVSTFQLFLQAQEQNHGKIIYAFKCFQHRFYTKNP